MVKIPHTEVTERCIDCEGRGETPCPVCNAGQEHGFYKANQMNPCWDVMGEVYLLTKMDLIQYV